jgi:endonuclease YncB( thermonuclease family)
LGYGWYDGNEFAGVDTFRQAQQEAREKQIGVWAQEATQPSWNFQNVERGDEIRDPGQSESPGNKK